MKKMIFGMTIILLFAGVLTAQTSLNGRWQGETRNHAQLLLNLTVRETVLTGSFTLNGQMATITDGNASKNSFTFKVSLGNQTEGFTGEFGDDQITIWMDRQGTSSAVVLKRFKN
jgi:hypothetical protein